MGILRALSETFIGRALSADFLDLPRWTLMNILCAVALLPTYFAAMSGMWLVVGGATLPAVPVVAGMINMSASHTTEKAMRLRDAFGPRATLFAVFIVWAGLALMLTLMFAGVSPLMLLVVGIIMLFLLVIGVFAVFMPSQLMVDGRLIGRNALVLAAKYPVTGLGLLVLGGVSAWLVAVSKGALIFVMPSLWVVLAAFTVNDLIRTMQAAQAE
ncbi:MAG: hypothetical protein JNL34_13595 [Anaerolineae bacterium]|nr:hypothetical protein [Anaerolineae bacterium]